METRNRFLDDLSKVAGGALGALGGLREEIEVIVRNRMERMLDGMDLVPREEFEAVKEVAAEARARQEELELRIAALEKAQKPGTVAAKSPTQPRRSAADTRRDKTATPQKQAPEGGSGS